MNGGGPAIVTLPYQRIAIYRGKPSIRGTHHPSEKKLVELVGLATQVDT